MKEAEVLASAGFNKSTDEPVIYFLTILLFTLGGVFGTSGVMSNPILVESGIIGGWLRILRFLIYPQVERGLYWER